MEFLQNIEPVFLLSTAPGGCGGLALFLFSLRSGHYKNNKYTAKLLIELLGAMCLASFVGLLLPEKVLSEPKHLVFASFAIGLSWVTIIQITRTKITKILKALIGEELGGET